MPLFNINSLSGCSMVKYGIAFTTASGKCALRAINSNRHLCNREIENLMNYNDSETRYDIHGHELAQAPDMDDRYFDIQLVTIQ